MRRNSTQLKKLEKALIAQVEAMDKRAAELRVLADTLTELANQCETIAQKGAELVDYIRRTT